MTLFTELMIKEKRLKGQSLTFKYGTVKYFSIFYYYKGK